MVLRCVMKLVREASGRDRRATVDRLGAIVVRAGGFGVIASILAILFFIVVEVWPLVRAARVERRPILQANTTVMGVASDPYQSHLATIDGEGTVRVRQLSDDREVLVRDVAAGAQVGHITADPNGEFFAWLEAGGRVGLVPVAWQVGFADGKRVVRPSIGDASYFAAQESALVAPIAARIALDGSSRTVAAASDDGQLVLFRRDREVNDFTEEVEESETLSSVDAPDGLIALALDDSGAQLFAATADGHLYRWDAIPRLSSEPEVVTVNGKVSSMTLLLGGRALVVGLERGAIQVWLRAPRGDSPPKLTYVREFPPHESAIRFLAPSRRGKGFVAVDERGGVGIYHSTSERVIWRGESGLRSVSALGFSPKADTVVIAGAAGISIFDVDNPHPDVSLRALFLPMWYEGYEKPEYVWQSSGGTDDFEPKYSLVPLLIGTLKGTFYSLLIAIPLGVLGAMYVSQFMHPRLRNVIKPTVEIMAALPSVVLGFLAGLWLAPRVEEAFSALILMVLSFPFVVGGTGMLWERLPLAWRTRMPVGAEAIAFCVSLAAATVLSILLSDPFEALVFGGNFQAWLLGATGLHYDQRNAIIVGLAMGFAVIPIIFAISEDAFSNVPRNLVSGSLALGANRWQTVSRIVLPTASPGIFSAIMIGFGRAVGETMIVLMATGNTPISEWNPFNGFRTLSANIAVEIPEAPQFGSLYRVLFLAALLLFMFTFVLNTAAELVRQRLRERYASL